MIYFNILQNLYLIFVIMSDCVPCIYLLILFIFLNIHYIFPGPAVTSIVEHNGTTLVQSLTDLKVTP